MKRPFLMLALLPLALPLSAQESATVTGTVTADGSGLASAQVVLSQLVTGAQYGGLTNDAGRYNIVGVPAGSYEVSVQVIGFTSESRR